MSKRCFIVTLKADKRQLGTRAEEKRKREDKPLDTTEEEKGKVGQKVYVGRITGMLGMEKKREEAVP